MNVALYDTTQDPLETIKHVLGTCSGKESTKDALQLAIYAYNANHWSVFEFVDFTFTIEGLSRVALAQLTRHRMASYAVKTSRNNLKLEFNFPVPGTSDLEENMESYFAQLEEEYGTDHARYFLPQAQAVDLMMKINLRSLINFMQERLCSDAGSEIQDLANQMLNCIRLNHIDDGFAKFADEVLKPKCFWLRRCPLGRNCQDFLRSVPSGQVSSH